MWDYPFIIILTSMTTLNASANWSLIARLRLSISPLRFLRLRRLFSEKNVDRAFKASSVSFNKRCTNWANVITVSVTTLESFYNYMHQKESFHLTMYKCVTGSAPDYLCKLISPYTPAHRLRSLSQSLAVKPKPKVASKTFYFLEALRGRWHFALYKHVTLLSETRFSCSSCWHTVQVISNASGYLVRI